MVAITQENCPEETIDKFVANYVEMDQKCEERWNDGRKHVAGDQITMADYIYLAGHTCVYTNTGLKNPSVRTKFHEIATPEAYPNMFRVLNNIMGPLQATVDRLQPTMI